MASDFSRPPTFVGREPTAPPLELLSPQPPAWGGQNDMRVLLVDDHGMFREGLRLLLCTLVPGIQIDQAPDCDSAVKLAGSAAYRLILLDWWMSGRSGRQSLEQLQTVSPSARVIVLSGDDRARVVGEAMEAGAAGFIHKGASNEVLLHALRVVTQGGVYAPAPGGAESGLPMGENGLRDVRECFPGLTVRQADVLQAVLQGRSNKQIARELNISETTVKTHVSAVLRAVNASSRTEAMCIASRKGVRVD